MEIFLNLAWAALGMFIIWTWMRMDTSRGADRRGRIIAIAVLIAILFPVISVSDDLMAAQNPAETDTCQRRDHLADQAAHPPLDLAAALPSDRFQSVSLAPNRFSSPHIAVPRVMEAPHLSAIQNRPPPAA